MTSPSLDRQTGRYYCSPCLEWTNWEILNALKLEGEEDYLPPVEDVYFSDLEKEEQEYEEYQNEFDE